MKPLHWVIILFWVFVTGMLLKQCHDTTVQRDEEAANAQKQFFFHQPTAPHAAPTPAPPPSPDADVEQVGYTVQPDTPTPGSFTCTVTLRNIGQKKATGIQIAVRPFRGARYGNDNVGHAPTGILPDSNPLAQLQTWLAFPDLGPGEQSTQSTVFPNHTGVEPGANPTPEIDYLTAKPPMNP
jgi:hypothetical protein